MCRRLLMPLALALLVLAALALPASAQTAPADNKRAVDDAAIAAATTAPVRAQMEASGLKYVGSFTRAVAFDLHDHGWTCECPQWRRGSTGRDYYFVVQIGVTHDVSPDDGGSDMWQPFFSLDCLREYDVTGDAAFNACNMNFDYFKALGWSSKTSTASLTTYGTANPTDQNCVYHSPDFRGAFRHVTETRPWVMSYVGYLQVNFLNNVTDCSGLHLSNSYRSASYRVNVGQGPGWGSFEYEEAYRDDFRTGLFSTGSSN